MKRFLFLILLTLTTTLTAQLKLEKSTIEDVVVLLENGEKLDCGGYWIEGGYIHINFTKYKVEGYWIESVSNSTIVIIGENIKLRIIYLNRLYCLCSILRYPDGVLRAYFNQELLEDE
jgi:hypothetical protein